MNQSEKQQVARATGIVGAATLLSRILGFVRDMVIAGVFGAGLASDAFFVAFRLPNLMRRLFAEGSLSMAFVPVLNQYLATEGKESAFTFARAGFRTLAAILFGIAVCGVLCAPSIVSVISPGFVKDPAKLALTIDLTRVMFPYVFFICLVALAMGLLNSLGHFAMPAFAPVMLNVSMIASVVLLSGHLSHPVMALAIGVVIGGVVQWGMQVPVLWRKGFRFRGPGGISHPGIKKVGRLMLPTVFGAAVYQISILLGTLLASLLEEGSVSYLYYADRLVQFPLAIFGISAATAVLPTLSRQVAAGRYEDLGDTFGEALRWMLFINLPAMAGLMALAAPIVALLFERGAFNAAMTKGCTTALFYYAAGLWSFACVRIVVSVFYAMQDTKTPVKMASLSLVANMVFAVVLMFPLSYGGLALATTLGSVVNLLLLSFSLHRKIPGLFTFSILKSGCRSAIGAAGMGGLVYGGDLMLADWLGGGGTALLIRVGGGIALGVIAYCGYSFGTRSPEFAIALRWLRRKV